MHITYNYIIFLFYARFLVFFNNASQSMASLAQVNYLPHKLDMLATRKYNKKSLKRFFFLFFQKFLELYEAKWQIKQFLAASLLCTTIKLPSNLTQQLHVFEAVDCAYCKPKYSCYASVSIGHDPCLSSWKTSENVVCINCISLCKFHCNLPGTKT